MREMDNEQVKAESIVTLPMILKKITVSVHFKLNLLCLNWMTICDYLWI